MMLKVIGFVVIVAISVAFSNVSFAQLGHDFFMKFFDFVLQEEDDEGKYLYTLPPSEERAEMEKEAAGTDTPEESEESEDEDTDDTSADGDVNASNVPTAEEADE